MPAKVNPDSYLGGGRDFGRLIPGTADIVSRNLTPDETGMPEGFDGTRLQIMPWPVFSKMTDHDLRAVYEHLRSIPCVSGPPAPSNLHNECQ